MLIRYRLFSTHIHTSFYSLRASLVLRVKFLAQQDFLAPSSLSFHFVGGLRNASECCLLVGNFTPPLKLFSLAAIDIIILEV